MHKGGESTPGRGTSRWKGWSRRGVAKCGQGVDCSNEEKERQEMKKAAT